MQFALEAKCYAVDSSNKVAHTTRLISRIRHRQFGVFVTTSYVHHQAYKEIVEDRHPVIILAGRDIVEILKQAGYSTKDSVLSWLRANF